VSDIPGAFRPFFCEKPQPFTAEYQNHGAIRFSEHLGKPLSDKLWKDLKFKLHPRTLRVTYEPMAYPEGPSALLIILDPQTNRVKDILWQAWYS
jgi:hypothetical protein